MRSVSDNRGDGKAPGVDPAPETYSSKLGEMTAADTAAMMVEVSFCKILFLSNVFELAAMDGNFAMGELECWGFKRLLDDMVFELREVHSYIAGCDKTPGKIT